jgi:predicted aspartyl protease
LPNWAIGSEDKRAALHWDTSQTIANCKINGVATLAIVDSGSYKTIMDTAMAKILGLRVRQAFKGDCGTYSVPGTGQTNAYEGVVDGEVRI